MAMNPETHHFEDLGTDQMLKDAVSKGWKIFRIGEKVTVNGVDFAVQDIAPTKLTLRPYGLTQLANMSGIGEKP
jgi:hypothetical protein